MDDTERVERAAERLYKMAADYGWIIENRDEWANQSRQYQNRWRQDAKYLLDDLTAPSSREGLREAGRLKEA